jgi:hypothetical protein
MPEFDEFRIQLTPDLQRGKDNFAVRITDCPVAALTGHKGTISIGLQLAQLQRLRNREGWPNLPDLTDIGDRVWQSIMNTAVESAFEACLAVSRTNRRSLRIIVNSIADESNGASGSHVRLAELPIEALHKAGRGFLATNTETPVSRTLQQKPDQAPHKILLPLRVLVVVATPNDQPTAKMNVEKQVIEDALSPYTAGRNPSVELVFCEPATRTELRNRLRTAADADRSFHVVHFITHGAFQPVDEDPTPRAHICLEDPANHKSDYVDANWLALQLQNTDVRLVVMTACSSSAASPNDPTYPIGAFDGIAQRLITSNSEVTAVVAMQFDLEAQAATIFSQTFYGNLMRPTKTLDEVITEARQAVASELETGHRAWVAPTLYWRCQEGRVFEIHKGFDAATLRTLEAIDSKMEIFREGLDDIARCAAPINLRDTWQQQLMRSLDERCRLLGDTARLQCGAGKPGDKVSCNLTLGVRIPGVIQRLKLLINYPADKLNFLNAFAGANCGTMPAIARNSPKQLTVSIDPVSGGQMWVAAEYHVGVLEFQLLDDLEESLIDVTVDQIQIERDNIPADFSGIAAVIFANRP